MAAIRSLKCLARMYPRRCFASTAQKQRVLNGYRRCLRTAHVMFAADVDNLRTKALPYIREQFESNRDLTDPDELEEALLAIDDAVDLVCNNIVRGTMNDRGNYAQPSSAILKKKSRHCPTHSEVQFTERQRELLKEDPQMRRATHTDDESFYEPMGCQNKNRTVTVTSVKPDK